MRFERRLLSGKPSLVLILESENESKIVDEFLGKQIPVVIQGSIELSDGYGQHYIHLWNPILCPEGRASLRGDS